MGGGEGCCRGWDNFLGEHSSGGQFSGAHFSWGIFPGLIFWGAIFSGSFFRVDFFPGGIFPDTIKINFRRLRSQILTCFIFLVLFSKKSRFY